MRALKALRRAVLGPSQREMVAKLIAGIAGLEILRDEFRTFAPLAGVHGPFRVEGNAKPTIHYTVFDKELMEFVEMRVSLALPDSINFEGKTEDLGVLETLKPEYKRPFIVLARLLYNYFPYPMPVRPPGGYCAS